MIGISLDILYAIAAIGLSAVFIGMAFTNPLPEDVRPSEVEEEVPPPKTKRKKKAIK